MSQWDPNDPNNPYNQQWQQQQGQWGQQPQQQQPQQQQQWDQQAQQQQQWQQQQQPQQQWDQQAQQQQQWDQQAQQQQQWDQQAQQQQYDQYGQQQPQQQYGQQQQYDQYGQQQQQQYGAQPQQDQQQGGGGFGFGGGGGGGFGFGGGQQPAYGQQAYQGAYNETFGNASDAVPGVIATLGVNERVQFLRRTYAHLLGAITAFVGLLFLFRHPKSPLIEQTNELAYWMVGGARWRWLIVLGAFAAVSFVADQWAQRASSKPMQYAGLGLYVLAEAVIFIPLIAIVQYVSSQPGFIFGVSGIITVALFAGLTATVFITKKDFSFLRGILGIGTMAALGIIIAGVIFGFSLGIFFAGAMLLLASGYVLFYTSRIMKYYHPNQYVAASLALFACIALILWYVIQIVMSLASD